MDNVLRNDRLLEADGGLHARRAQALYGRVVD